MSQPKCVVMRGDCVELMKGMAADSVDAIVTDPPYGIDFMGKDWDGFGTPLGFQTWTEQWAREAFRVLKPGGHLLAFGGTRMYHRLASGVEDAGFEVRDMMAWLYGSGFPKSHDVSKAIDKAAGAERKVIKTLPAGSGPLKTGHVNKGGGGGLSVGTERSPELNITAPATEEARRWEGWGTALKPAQEPIVVARKPLIGTVAENVLAHGTGAINIDASRISIAPGDEPKAGHRTANFGTQDTISGGNGSGGWTAAAGRWPANVLFDEEAAAVLDEQSGQTKSTLRKRDYQTTNGARFDVGESGIGAASSPANTYDDRGGASRFFYVAKAGKKERNAVGIVNIHPTVKPIALMGYLIKMVTPPGGVVLDPFLGSGSTACAAIVNGFDCIGIEQNKEYADIAEARIAHWAKEAK